MRAINHARLGPRPGRAAAVRRGLAAEGTRAGRPSPHRSRVPLDVAADGSPPAARLAELEADEPGDLVAG